MLDASIFSKYKTKQDFDQERAEFDARKRQQAMQEQLGGLQVQQAQKDLNEPAKSTFQGLLAQYNLNPSGMNPQQMAQLKAYQQIEASKMSQNPLTGQTYAKNRPIVPELLGSPSQINAMPPKDVIAANIGGRDIVDVKPTGVRNDSGEISPTTQNVPLPTNAGFQDVGAQPDLPNNGLPQDMIDPSQTITPNTEGLYLPQELAVREYAAKEDVKSQYATREQRAKLEADKHLLDYKGAKAEQKKQVGREQIDLVLQDILGKYKQLNELGGIRSIKSSVSENMKNYIATTDLGQEAGKFTGTQAQSLRDDILAYKPKMMGAMKDALALTGTELNSKPELMFYLNALTNPTNSIESNLDIIQRLSRDWGAGGLMNAPIDRGGEKAVIRAFNPATGRLE